MIHGLPNESKVTDHKLRRLSREDRRELYSYVPHKEVLGMEVRELEAVLADEPHDRHDLFNRIAYDLYR